MPSCVFHRSVLLDAPIETVFRFHGNPLNVSKIQPPGNSVEVLESQPEPHVGETFRLTTQLGPFPMEWIGEWEQVEPPFRLVDVARKSPFALFRHHHLFRRVGDSQTLMTDRVEYLFGPSPFALLLSETGVRLQLHILFAERHRRTADYFRSPASKSE